MRELKLPMTPQDVATLTVGERVTIHGRLFTTREAGIRKVVEAGTVPFETRGSMIYHCGPLTQRVGSRWEFRSAAPEEASTIESYLGELFGRFGFCGIIGRGGGGTTTLTACRRYNGVYLQTIGGAGLALARRVVKVLDPHMKDELDARDAIWEVEVENFPAVVTMDSQGRNLHDIVRDVSSRRFLSLVD